MEYKNMTDSELATIMVNYINRIDHLRGLIVTYLDSVDHGCIQPIRIKELYKQLKYELRDDYNYLDLARNKQGSRIYMYYFSPSIREAFAWGFTVPVNGAVNYASPVAFKSQFIMSLLKQIDPDGIRAHHKSIIDRCVALTLQKQKRTGKVATLCTLREKLLEQPEPEARDLALTMELYTSGSLNIFAHETNVDTKNRIQSYDIHDLGEELKQPGFVTITDAMINRVNYNSARGKKTHIIVDEFHIAYENEYSGNFFTSAWRQFRKRNASPVAITQNVEYMLDSVQASTMVSNSEFVVMLNQAESDQERLSKLLNISPEQMSYVNGSDAGCGLMRYGNALVPFVNRFPSDTELYKLITTKPGEGAFAKGQVDSGA